MQNDETDLQIGGIMLTFYIDIYKRYPQNEKNGWNNFLLSVRRRVRYGL